MEDFKNKVNMMSAPELDALKDYVTAGDAIRYDGQAEGTLRLDVCHSNLIQRWHDIIFHETMNIQAVKEKLHRHGGSAVDAMELYLRRGGDTILMADDSKTLKYYGCGNGMEIFIKDDDQYSMSKGGGLEDVSQVEKYEMDDDTYDARPNTVRAQKRAEALAIAKAQRAAGVPMPDLEEPEGIPIEVQLEEFRAKIPIDSRCEVDPGGRRGSVAYVGTMKGAKGVWVGVVLDEPQGMNDGTKDGKKYFECKAQGYGCFAKPEHVTVGDFPEIDPFASDDEF